MQSLDEVRTHRRTISETTFALATGYLRIGKADRADALFAAVAAEHPQPETYVLIGRIYRDAGIFARAHGAQPRAGDRNPRATPTTTSAPRR